MLNNLETVREKQVDVAKMTEIAEQIERISEEFDLDKQLYAAILMQESRYGKHKQSCYGIKEGKEGYDYFKALNKCSIKENLGTCLGKIKPRRLVFGCHDFGISMINKNTAKLYKFDLAKITHSTEYAIRCGAVILSQLKKSYMSKESTWWTRYNASGENLTARKAYYNQVTKWLPKIPLEAEYSPSTPPEQKLSIGAI